METTPYVSIAKITKLYDFCLWFVGYQKSVEHFVEQIPFDRNAHIKILDAGCGTGLYTLAMFSKYPNARITSFDLDKGLVDTLRGKLQKGKLKDRAHLFVADIQGPLQEITGDKFNLVITAGVLEYTELEKTVKNLSRFLVSGGYFLNSPVKHNSLGKLICWLFACKPYKRTKNIEAFTKNGFILIKSVVPNSFKELHIFKYQNKFEPVYKTN